jgi:hypothetical protein
VGVRGTFGTHDAGSHLPFYYEAMRTVVGEDARDSDEKCVEVLAEDGVGEEAVSGKRSRDIEADHVLLRMAGNGDVVVINQDFDGKLLAHTQARGFGVVALHL